MFRALFDQRKRKALLSKTNHPDMIEFLTTPPPDLNQPSHTLPCLAADLEMSGLNADQDQILSVGYVAVDNREIILSTATHKLVAAANADLTATAPIHNIRNLDLQSGDALEEILVAFLKALAGRVLILHHSPLDMSFLNIACNRLFGVPLLTPVTDTLKLEQHRYRTELESRPQGYFRLHACRNRYNLPNAPVHNALSDALATAELFLAQHSYVSHDKPTPAKQFITG